MSKYYSKDVDGCGWFYEIIFATLIDGKVIV